MTGVASMLIAVILFLEFNPKTAGRGQFNPPCGFLKNVSSNIIISHNFLENFIEIPQIVQNI